MLWQDLVLTCGQLIFALALIPSVIGKDKPAVSTSITTGIVLLIFAFVYVTLSLWFSAITTTFTGVVWSILAIQKIHENQTSGKH